MLGPIEIKSFHYWWRAARYRFSFMYKRVQRNNNYYWNVLRTFFKGWVDTENNIFVYRNNFSSYPIVVQFVNNTYWIGRLFRMHVRNPHPKAHPFVYTHARSYLSGNNVCCPFSFFFFFFYSSAITTRFSPGQTFTHVYYVCPPNFFFISNCCRQFPLCAPIFFLSLINPYLILSGANPRSRCNQLAVDQVNII